MCGFAGVLADHKMRLDGALKRLCAALAHRGPDDWGVETLDLRGDRRLGLVHRRLSILDLSVAGHQPMINAQTGDCIVFNGEIYNFRDLRAELEAAGQRFSSTCDTEVVLKGYAVWGRGVLQRLRGMFALGLVDGGDGHILLARDRVGIKPLYYASCPCPGVDLLFASEVRAILASGLIRRAVCAPAIAQYLVNGYVPDPLTIIAGVKSLLPGHYVEFAPDGCCVGGGIFWARTGSSGNGVAWTRAQAARRVREVLEEAVCQHLVSDVPLGAFLSGGVDSSVLVALMAQHDPEQVETFSLVFNDPALSEEQYSRAVARHLRTHHHECRLGESEFLLLVEPALAALDQPSTNGINNYVVSRKCREVGLTVALAGTGGDELFGGYTSFSRVPRSLRILQGLHLLPAPLRRVVRSGLQHRLLRKRGYAPSAGGRGKLAALLDLPADLLSVYHLSRMVLLPPVIRDVLSHNMDGDAVGRLPATLLETVRARLAQHQDTRAQVSVCEQMLYLCDQLLRDTDSVSMAVALEVRVPLLDHVLVETVETLPPPIRFGGRRPKALLIDAVRDILPRAAYERRKQGFVLPLGRWLAGGLRGRVTETLSDRDALAAAGLEPEPAWHLVQDCLEAGQRIYFTRLWSLFVLVDWCRRHGVVFEPATAVPEVTQDSFAMATATGE